MKIIPVWDLPLRLFHWGLASVVVAALITVEIGGDAIEWHARLGYAVLALLFFRLFWGVAGGTYALMPDCMPHPRRLIAFLRGEAEASLGHTETGKVAVAFIFVVLWFQSFSGLFANDDVDLRGPLYHLVSKALSDSITNWHKYSFWLIVGFVVMHVGAIIYYRLVRGENLVLPMLSGRRVVADDFPDELASRGGSLWLGLILFALSAAGVWGIVEFV